MKICAVGKRLLVRPIDPPASTPGGIALPQGTHETGAQRAEILDVGNEFEIRVGYTRYDADTSSTIGLAILAQPYAGVEVKGPEGEKWLLLHQDEVLAVVQE